MLDTNKKLMEQALYNVAEFGEFYLKQGRG
jgi:hypothetical protein